MAEFPDDIAAIGRALVDADAILVNKAKATMVDVLDYVESEQSDTWADASPGVATGDSIVSAATFAGGRYVQNGDVVTCSGQLDVTTTDAGAVLVLVAAPVAFEISSPPTGRGGACVADVAAVLAGSQPIVGFVGPYPVGATTTGAIAVAFVSTGAATLSFPFTVQYGVTS